MNSGFTQAYICVHCDNKWVKEMDPYHSSVNSLVKTVCEECSKKGLKSPTHQLLDTWASFKPIVPLQYVITARKRMKR